MQFEVRLPSLGEDADERAVVAYWLVDEGDEVCEGADLLELTTDKAAFNVPAPKTGVLLEKTVEEGDPVSAEDLLCILEVPVRD